MSSARSAPPCAVCVPATAQLLLPRDRRRRPRIPRPIGAPRKARAPGSGGGGRAAAAAAGCARRRSTTSGPGTRGQRDRVALDRRVPLGAHGSEEVRERGRRASRASGRARTPATAGGPAGRGTSRARTAASPPRASGAGSDAQGQVLEGRRAERGEARVRRPPCRRRAGPARPAAAPRRRAGRRGAAGATRASRSSSSAARAEERGELAGGAAPQQVHLEEALLRVQEAGGARHVERGSPPRTTGTPSASRSIRTGAPQAGERALALELRQARAQPRVEVRAGPAARERQRRERRRRRRAASAAARERPASVVIAASGLRPSTGWRRPRPPSSPPRGRRGSSADRRAARRRARRRAGSRSGC